MPAEIRKRKYSQNNSESKIHLTLERLEAELGREGKCEHQLCKYWCNTTDTIKEILI